MKIPEINEVKEWLSNNGIGTGTNITVGAVAQLIVSYYSQLPAVTDEGWIPLFKKVEIYIQNNKYYSDSISSGHFAERFDCLLKVIRADSIPIEKVSDTDIEQWAKKDIPLVFKKPDEDATVNTMYHSRVRGAKAMRDGLIPASGNTVKEECMTDLRTLMLLISSRIDQGYDMSNSDLKALWNSLSDIVTKLNDIPSAPDIKIEKGKEEFKTPQWFLDRKKKRTKKYNG